MRRQATHLVLLGTIALMAGLSPLALRGASGSSAIIGQLVGTASLDGVIVPGGTALLAGSRITTLGHRVSVQLATGQVIEVGRNSSAVFSRNEGGEVELLIQTGQATVRETNGELATLIPEDSVTFSERRMGDLVRQQEKVVAVLAQRAEEGTGILHVLDAAQVEPTGELLIRSRDGLLQEVTCRIEKVDQETVRLSQDIGLTFEPDDLLIQRLRVPEKKTYTTTTEPASSGSRMLNVADSKVINPLEHLVVRSPDGRTREVACIDYTHEKVSDDEQGKVEQSVVRVAADLDHDFPIGSELIQGQNSSSEETVTLLVLEAKAGQRALRVEHPEKIDPLQQLMILSPDGSRFEAYCIYSIVDDRVRLAEDLDYDYPVGSRVVQGRSAQNMIADGVALQRTANCCCCCQQVWVAGGAWWRWVVGGAAAAGTTTAVVTTNGTTAPPPTTTNNPPPPSAEPPPPPGSVPSPIAPRKKRPGGSL